MELSQNKTLLSKSSSSALKIIFEIMVLIHHLYTASTALGDRIDGALGVVAVGGFLIISGFGVGVSYLAKGDKYREKILKSRIPRLYAIILIADLFYLWLYFYTGNTFSNFFDLLVSLFYLPIFNGFVALSHYIYFLADLIIYYVAFLIFSYLFRTDKKPLLSTAVAIIALELLTIAILSFINAETGSNRHLRACLCFPLGLLLAEILKDGNGRELFKELKWTLVVWLFVVGVAICAITDNASIMEYVLPIVASSAIVVLFFGVEIKSKALNYASQLVLYVYASHELFRELFEYCYPNLHTNVIGVIVVLLSVMVAFVIHELVKGLSDRTNENSVKKA